MTAKPNRRAAPLASAAALAALVLLAPGRAQTAPVFGLGAIWSGVDANGDPASAPFVVVTETGNDPFSHPWAFSSNGRVWAMPSPGGGTTDFNPVGRDFVATGLRLTIAGTGLPISVTGTFFQTSFGDWDVSVAGDTVIFSAPVGLELVGDPFFPSAFAVQVSLAPAAPVPAPPAALALGLGLLGLAAVARRRAG